MKLQVFIDDSAADSGDKRLFLCGYINTVDSWANFSTDWQRALSEYPKIEYFKMSEAFSLNGPFYGWSETDRNKKVALLAGIIRKYNLLSISCSISRNDYANIVAPVAPYFIGRPYYVCFQMITIGAARLFQGVKNTLPVQYIFDEQGQIGRDSAMFHEDIKNTLPPEINNMMGDTPIFKNDKYALPLQAADMLAWHIRSEHEFPERKLSFSADHIMGSSHAVYQIERDTMERWAKQFSLLPGVGLTKDKKNWSKLKKEIVRLRSIGIDPSKIKWPLKARIFYWLRKLKSNVWSW